MHEVCNAAAGGLHKDGHSTAHIAVAAAVVLGCICTMTCIQVHVPHTTLLLGCTGAGTFKAKGYWPKVSIP